MSGMTLKQFARKDFWEALNTYKAALANAKDDSYGFLVASLRIHAALGREGVPKAWKRYVTAAWREATTETKVPA